MWARRAAFTSQLIAPTGSATRPSSSRCPVTSLPNGEALPVGAMLGIQTPEGDVMRVRVLEVGDEEVMLDCNHELAGQNLNFDITLVDVVSETPFEHELHPEGCTCGCDRLQESLAAGE